MILKTFLSTISSGIHFFIKQKLCNIFYEAENDTLKRQDSYSKFYLLFDLL